MSDLRDVDAVATDLLGVLRAHLESPSVGFAEPPRRLTGGRDTTVYAFRLDAPEGPFARPLVLRLFAGERGPRRARMEATVQNAVAAQGYPCPRVLVTGDEDRIAGAAFTVMELVPGVPAITAIEHPSRLTLRLPGLLAETHAALHALDATPLIEAARDLGAEPAIGAGPALASIESRVDGLGLDELRPAVRWLREHRPEDGAAAICHSDFHPGNVMLEDDHVSGVIDWANVQFAEPAFDVARTSVVQRCGPVDVPAALGPVVTGARGLLTSRYIAAYRRAHPLDATALRYYEALHAMLLYTLGYEMALEPYEGTGNGAWAPPEVASRLAGIFEKRTGIVLARARLGEMR